MITHTSPEGRDAPRGAPTRYPFLTQLRVAHLDRDTWELTGPLIWKGRWQYLIIREGFRTDFASIPKVLRWLLDNAGANAEAGVLHDAVWRESKRKDTHPRIDPWYADGILRRALRETGSTALTRTLIWFGVRITASVSGRFGKKGPSRLAKVLQLLAALALGSVTALGPTLVAGGGLVVFWIFNWICAVGWYLIYERRVFKKRANWPWPLGGYQVTDAGAPTSSTKHVGAPGELLLAIDYRPDPFGAAGSAPSAGALQAAAEIEQKLALDPNTITDADIERWKDML